VVGRINKVKAAPEGSPWFWTLAYGYHYDCTPIHGYEATREAAMAAFAVGSLPACWARPASGHAAALSPWSDPIEGSVQ
jgi:hypothetical protein